MKTPRHAPLKLVPTDCSELDRQVVRVAATGTNEELAALVKQLKHRAALELVSSDVPCDAHARIEG